MPDTIAAPSTAGLSLGDIYYILFRHKWKIMSCTAAGLAAAAAVWQFAGPPYESQAKLYVRYVLSDRAIGPTESAAKSPDQRGETIMNSEREILTSVDVARRVAEAVGPEKILSKAGGGKDITAATVVVRTGLTVLTPPASSVLYVDFKHRDPELVQPVLREVVAQYLKLHVETHTGSGLVGDVLSQETDQLRSRLSQTEDELRKALAKAGVINLEDAKKMYAEQIAAIRRDRFATEAELALRTSALEQVSKRLPSRPAAIQADTKPIPAEVLSEYRSLSNQIDLLQRMEQELLTQFTEQSPRVAEVHAQLTAATERRDKIQERFPRLAGISPTADAAPNADAAVATNLATEIAALQSKLAVLKAQLDALHGETTRLEQMEGTVTELRRKKELEEANYRYYSATLEQSRINEALGNGHVSNIIEIQTPSPPFSDRTKSNKMIGVILVGAIAAGFAWAFLTELYLDRSIKRPIDVERALASPLLLSIPSLSPKLLRPAAVNGNGNGASNGGAPHGHPLVVYHETLRDRIIGYFESIGLVHKPKLVAVTSIASKAGVSTTATGLARSLSETGDGNVLLVDMNKGEGTAQQFAKGQAVSGLEAALESRDAAHVEDKLYMVVENSNHDRLSRSIPKRFTALVPKLKASDFDYIIFDMPPVSQTSITPRLAGFMDLVLVVIQSERSDREFVQRAMRLLGDSRVKVGVVLNQTRRYVPARLDQEAFA